MRRLLTIATLITGLVCFASTYAEAPANNKQKTASAETAPKLVPPSLTDLSLSFVQTAKSALLRAIPGEPKNYTLTLYDVTPYTTYFYHRPNRISGIATSKDFIDAWKVGKNNFEINNPNCVIIPSVIDGAINRSETFYIVRLSSPIYKADKKGIISIRYTATLIGLQNIFYKQMRFDYVILVIG